MLFDRAEKPNTTIEEWGVITRTGLFAHGTDPNPLVGPSSYICHSGTGTAQGLEVIRKNCFDWTKKYEKRQAESLLPTKWSVKCLIEKLNNTRFTASDVQQSAPHPTAMNVVRSFNATSTEHELYERAFSGIGLVRSQSSKKQLAETSSQDSSEYVAKPLALSQSHEVLAQEKSEPKFATAEQQMPTQDTLRSLGSWGQDVGVDQQEWQQVAGFNHERLQVESTKSSETEKHSLQGLDMTKSEKQFESVQTELNELENELNEMLRKFELQNLIKSKIEQTQSKKLKEAVERARDAAERFDHAVHSNTSQVHVHNIAAIPRTPPSPHRILAQEEKSNAVLLSLDTTNAANSERRRLNSRPRQKSPKRKVDAEKHLLRDIERLTRKLELYRPYNDEEAGFADDEEEHKDEEGCAKRVAINNDSSKKSTTNPVFNAVHELMNEVEA